MIFLRTSPGMRGVFSANAFALALPALSSAPIPYQRTPLFWLRRSFHFSSRRALAEPRTKSSFNFPLLSLLSPDNTSKVSSIGKIARLARPERKSLLSAVGLLVVSSSVSLSIPFTIGKLIDFFASPHPVSHIYHDEVRLMDVCSKYPSVFHSHRHLASC